MTEGSESYTAATETDWPSLFHYMKILQTESPLSKRESTSPISKLIITLVFKFATCSDLTHSKKTAKDVNVLNGKVPSLSYEVYGETSLSMSFPTIIS